MRSKPLKCPFTHSEINLGTYSKLHHKFNLSKDEFKFKIYHHNFGDVVMFNEFKQFYLDKMYSLPDFLKEFGMSYEATQWLIKYHNIEKRNLKSAINTNRKKKKSKSTCIERYGVENVSQNKEIKEKKRQTFLKNYGVDNIRKSKDFCNWLDSYMIERYGQKRITGDPIATSERTKKTWTSFSEEEKLIRINKQVQNLQNFYSNLSEEERNAKHKHWRFGWEKWRESLTEEQKEEIRQQRILNNKKYWNSLTDEQKQEKLKRLCSGKISKLELTFKEYLDILEIEYQHNFYIGRNQFDYKLTNTNILIEIHGDFWHANPSIYKPQDILPHPRSINKTAKDIWDYDNTKVALAEKHGYTVIVFWENFLINATKEQILEKLYNEIKIYNQDSE